MSNDEWVPRTSETWVGALLDGRYRIDAPLGSGGMGSVYLATHIALGEMVAIKVLQATWAARADIQERFRREAVALARLRHPSIVSILDYGVHEGTPYLVLEVVRGQPVSNLLRAEGALPPARAIEITVGVLRALEAAHAQGIIHRDIKPGNIMVLAPPAQGIKLLDFGLALIASGPESVRLTRADMVQGTPSYMAPEQCSGRDPITAAADLYAVATTLYEMLSGHAPFESGVAAHIMALQLFSTPRRLATLALAHPLPDGLSELVARGLAKKADERPSLQAFREELEGCLDGTASTSRAEAQAHERARVGALSRAERSLTAAPEKHTLSDPPEADTRAHHPPLVWLWDLPRDRENALHAALATHGVQSAPWFGASPPPPAVGEVRALACLLAYGPNAAARVAQLAGAEHPLGALVLDVNRVEDTATMIRAGAADVALADLDDAALMKKVARMLRRRR